MALAQRHNLVVIEDAAQAWGASWQGRMAGTLGHAAGFSFQSSKNITAGEGGMILSNDTAIGAMARSLSNSGRQPDGLWYAHYVLGGNYRLSELHGASCVCNYAATQRNSPGGRPTRPIWSKRCQKFQASRRYARTHG